MTKSMTGLSPVALLLASAAVAPLISGSEGEGSGSGGSAGSGSKDGDGKDGGPEGGKDDKSKPSGDADKRIASLEEERQRHYDRRKEAERERDELKKWKEEAEAKDLGEVEKRDKIITKHEAAIAKLQATIDRLAINNAFLSENDVTWHNPARAMAMLDLSDIKVNEDGSVDGAEIKKRIKKLADDEPYLVKSDDQDGDKKKQTPPGSGRPPAGSGDDKKKSSAELASKYPALRSRFASKS